MALGAGFSGLKGFLCTSRPFGPPKAAFGHPVASVTRFPWLRMAGIVRESGMPRDTVDALAGALALVTTRRAW